MSSGRMEVDMLLNAKGVAQGADDAAMALADLEDAIDGVADESQKSGRTVDSFAKKVVDAARQAGKSDDEIKDALRSYGVNAKDAERAIGRLGDEFQETGRDGSRAADKLEDSLRDVQRQSEKTERSVDDIGSVGGDGFRKLSASAEEASGELSQNLGETFSSFRGDLEDLPQIAQDVFGGLAGSAGTLTASLGLAGVAGAIGLAVAGFQEMQKQEEERKQRVADWASTYISSLGQMTDAVADFAAVEAIYTDPEKYAEAEKNAKNWGVSLSTAANAMAGDTSAIAVAQQNVADSTDTWKAALERAGGDLRGLNHDMRTMRAESNQGQEALDKLTGEMDEGRARADNYSKSLLEIVKSAGEATVEVDELGNSVYTLPDGQQIMIDAETGQATTDVKNFKGDLDGIPETVKTTAHVEASVRSAQNTINRFIAANDGKSFRLHGRVTVDNGGWDG